MLNFFMLSGALLLSVFTFAQEAVVSTGGDVYDPSGEVNFTVGEMAFEETSTAAGSSDQGVQVPSIDVLTSLLAPTKDLTIEIFPNPVLSQVEISSSHDVTNLYFSIIDLNGKMLEPWQMMEHLSTISMSDYSPGVYHLRVAQGNQLLKTFQLTKL